MKFSLLLLSFLFAAITISAQVNPQCPMVTVTGPAGIVEPGQLIPFVAEVKPTESKLTFKWSVSRGIVAEGQGTSVIKVRVGPDDPRVTATVEIGGLPQDCLNTASESVSNLTGDLPIPRKLDTFSLPLTSNSSQRLQLIADEINNNATSQLYVFVPADQASRDVLIARLEESSHRTIDRSGITFVDTEKDGKIVEIWLVPPGATSPSKCEACVKPQLNLQDCPTIKVAGPSGLIKGGELVTFKASADRSLPTSSNFQWTVSAGTIETGQRSSSIRVRAPSETAANPITANVRLNGPDSNCLVSASETVTVASVLGPEPTDSYGNLSLNDEKARLQNAAYWLEQTPGYKLFIFKRYPRFGAQERRRINDITKWLTTNLKVTRERFRIITSYRPQVETMIVIARPNFEAEKLK